MIENLISIVVPVYNVENYLKKCVDSLINQTYKNIEIILVDDGSVDKSSDICLEYQKKDNRIKYFKQKNCGAAAARNKGIENAQGEYIGFVDSDDYVDNDMYECLINNIKNLNADVAQILSRRIAENGNVINQEIIKKNEGKTNEVFDSNCAIKHYLIGNHSLCSHLYKASLFDNLKIPENITGEDLAIIIPLYSRANKVVKINTYKYNYRFNQSSVTNSGLTQRAVNLYYEYKKQLHIYQTNTFYSEILTAVQFKTLNGIINEMVLFGDDKFDNNEYYFKNELKKNFKIFKNSKYVSIMQILKLELYIINRTFYKKMLILKRKNYSRPLYGDE